jgi:hypothetical protein
MQIRVKFVKFSSITLTLIMCGRKPFYKITQKVSQNVLRIRYHPSWQSVSRSCNNLRAEDRIPLGARFSAPIQTGPGAHPASCKMGTGSLSVRGRVDSQGHSAVRRIMSMKYSNDTIGNRTRDLPACSAVPQPTTSPRAPKPT